MSLQLGEPGNPLQGMAVLTHVDVRQLEEYVKDPLASDRRFLASLQKMSPAPQQRAAAIMQMAAGAVPPPAVLVWAAQEVVAQVRSLLRERLLGDHPAAEERQQRQQQQQQGTGGPSALVSEPWYEGALQLARLAKGGFAEGTVRTELELMRAFAADSPTTAETPTAAAAVAPESYVATWEGLLALPQLQSLLQAAASRSAVLASVLELAGLRPGPDVTSAAASPPPGDPAASGGGAGGKAKQRQQQSPAAAPAAAATGGAWLLPALRSAAAAARAKALRLTGLTTAGADAPLDADAALTVLALGAPRGEGASAAAAAAVPAEHRVAAADWLAAATLLRHAEERLGCAGGATGVRQDAVAALHLLGLPLEPRELPYLDELKVSEHELKDWLSRLSMQLAASARPAGSPQPAAPPALESRLAAAQLKLAAAGRALALAAPKPGSTAVALAPEAAATQAWLRAVGAPLVSGLLFGGYGSLAQLRSMVPELREALVLRLLETGRMQGGTTALVAALYGDADAAWRGARVDGAGAATAAALLQQEAVAAELDLVHERFVAAPVAAPPAPRPLPSDAALTAAVQALPPPARLLYDSYYVLRAEGGDDAAVVSERRRVADALAAAGEGAALQGLGDLQAWLAESRKGLLLLPAPLLALLLRFLRVQVAVTPDEAQSQRNKLTALALLVAEQQRRAMAAAVASAGGEAGDGAQGGGDGAAAAAELAAQELAEWSRSGGGAVSIASDGAGGRVPSALAALLGPAGAVDFTSWLQALALHATSSPASTHRLLAQQHLDMDVERYLTMSHDPRLHLPRSGLPPPTTSAASAPPSTTTSWTDPALRRIELEFLEDMRPQLDVYLMALGHRPLGNAEWGLYRDAALQEWEAGRREREERLEAAGQSGFFNPRADEVYLQHMLEQGIPIDDPLGPQSRRYLDTLLRNPSWTFAQRHQAVQRLIQLNSHFGRQPLAPEGGSPFAPLFAVGGPDVVPRLGAWNGSGGTAEAEVEAEAGNGGREMVPRPRQGGGSRGGLAAAAPPLQLPKGF